MPILIQIGIMIVSALIQYALTPKQKAPSPDSNLDVPTVTDGTPKLVVFGDCNLDGSMELWYGDEYSTPIKSKGK